MRIFITGGSGFLGGRIVEKLVARGHEVIALARSTRAAEIVSGLGAEPVMGDITKIETLAVGMRGSDVLFHVAGWDQIGGKDSAQAIDVNIDGSRNVLSLAFSLNIPKIIYTSSTAIFGDTKGKFVDENYYMSGPFLSEHDRTKWIAHYEVVHRLIKKGAPIINVIPGGIYGPGDKSLINDLMCAFYRGALPIYISPGLMLTFGHVEDIAEGHILALEKGRIGESYILAGPALSFSEVLKLWGELTGRAPPWINLPSRLVQPLGPFVGVLEDLFPVPNLIREDTINSSNATYLAKSDKAVYELGWQPRSLLDGFRDTFDWIGRHTVDAPLMHTRNRQIAGISLTAGLVLLFSWLLGRQLRK